MNTKEYLDGLDRLTSEELKWLTLRNDAYNYAIMKLGQPPEHDLAVKYYEYKTNEAHLAWLMWGL